MPSKFSEILHIGGYKMAMCCLPLGAYLDAVDGSLQFQGWRGCSHGYQGTWKLIDGRLYLTKLIGTLEDGSQATLAALFPDSSERVLAEWYTGPVIEPDVHRTKYVPRGGCIYDCDLFINVDNGVVSEAYMSRAGGPKNTDEAEWRYGSLISQRS